MTLTVGVLLAKCVHSLQRVPIPLSFLFKQLLAMKCIDGQKCKVKSLADGFKFH